MPGLGLLEESRGETALIKSGIGTMRTLGPVMGVKKSNCSEENSLRKFIQTSYIKQIHQNSEYLLDKCYIFFFKLLNLILLIQSSTTVVNNKACKLTHYLMLVVNVPGC